MMRRSAVSFCLLALTAFLASACSHTAEETVPSSPTEPLPPSYIRTAPAAPPTAPFEQKPPLSDPQTETWRPGYWVYENGMFSWVAGAVIPKPTLTANWSPDRWEKRQYGWVFVPGYWQ
jgi:hypothetical protein